MKIKEIDRTANIAWSPAQEVPIQIAVGTAAQQLDKTFSTSAVIEFYQFDVNQEGLDMPIKASYTCENRFHKLLWGSKGISEGQSSILVAGSDDGLMSVYDPQKIMKNENPLLFTKNKHTGAVKSMDFNCFRPNLLASGACESEIYIWDLTNPKTAMTTGSTSLPPEDVLHLKWNKQVEHILASTFPSKCVFWDLRKSVPIIKLADNNTKMKYKCADWHPTTATQICIASEEDSNPAIQLWDLRNATAPLKTLVGHERGVMALDWCTHDPDLLISCCRDSKILCWNPNYPMEGYELLYEIPTSNQWAFDVAFCPRNPLVVSSCSFDGRVSLFSLGGSTSKPVTSSQLADSFPGMELHLDQTPLPSHLPTPVHLRDAPKWLKRPCGATFAFGGKLVSYRNVKREGGADGRVVEIGQVVTQPQFLAKSQKLEGALASGDLSSFCADKVLESANEEEMEIWKFLQASFSVNPKEVYLNILGFNSEDIVHKLQDIVKKETQEESMNDSFMGMALGSKGKELGFDNHLLTGDAAVFDNISQKSSSCPTPDPEHTTPFHILTDQSPEGLLNQALLAGQIELGVELCIKGGKWADALILASTSLDPHLLRKTQIKYFHKCPNEASNVIRAIVTGDLRRLVDRVDLEFWKQALATTLINTNDDEFRLLAEILGKRLEVTGSREYKRASMLCYICSGNISGLVEGWTMDQKNKENTPEGLQNIVEQIMILQKAAETRGSKYVVQDGALTQKLVEYASLLSSQGSLQAALNYLPESRDPEVVALKERLYYALGLARSARAPRSRNTSLSENLRRTPPTQSYVAPSPVSQVPRAQVKTPPNQFAAQSYAPNPGIYQPAQPPQGGGGGAMGLPPLITTAPRPSLAPPTPLHSSTQPATQIYQPAPIEHGYNAMGPPPSANSNPTPPLQQPLPPPPTNPWNDPPIVKPKAKPAASSTPRAPLPNFFVPAQPAVPTMPGGMPRPGLGQPLGQPQGLQPQFGSNPSAGFMGPRPLNQGLPPTSGSIPSNSFGSIPQRPPSSMPPRPPQASGPPPGHPGQGVGKPSIYQPPPPPPQNFGAPPPQGSYNNNSQYSTSTGQVPFFNPATLPSNSTPNSAYAPSAPNIYN